VSAFLFFIDVRFAISFVMPGLDPGIHALLSLPQDVDGRVI
jgi:hypothetical protein